MNTMIYIVSLCLLCTQSCGRLIGGTSSTWTPKNLQNETHIANTTTISCVTESNDTYVSMQDVFEKDINYTNENKKNETHIVYYFKVLLYNNFNFN